ncbi:hypothetical protein B0J14DRAFT_240440 [Halenospora varia]|nr:hypothetical protein B0J14DRAFT_240440 [Halenospora varia]
MDSLTNTEKISGIQKRLKRRVHPTPQNRNIRRRTSNLQKQRVNNITGPFTKEIISLLPSTVEYICHSGVGYDKIDVEACSFRGIQVSNTPHCNEPAVADLTIYLMIGALRRITAPSNALRAGTPFPRSLPLPFSLRP